MVVEQVERRVGVVERVELAVGLVDERATYRGTCGDEAAIRSSGSAVVVGLFGLQTITARRDGDLCGHRVEVVAVVASSGTGSPGARGGREVRVDAERRPGVDELGARLEQRLAGCQQDVAEPLPIAIRAAGHAVAVARGRARSSGVGRVGVAVERHRAPRDRLDDLRQRRDGRLVGGQHRDVLGQRVAVAAG